MDTKRFFRKVGMIAMASVMINLNACSKVNNDMANEICSSLNDKYGETFIVTHIGDRLDKNTAKLYVRPQNKPNAMFTVIMDNEGNMNEDYVPNLMASIIEDSFASLLMQLKEKCTVKVCFANNVYEDNNDISLDEFIKRNNIDIVYINIIMDLNNVEHNEYGQLIDALESLNSSVNVKLAVGVYIYDKESYMKCRRDFLEYPYVGPTTIRSYNPLYEFGVIVQNGKASISREDVVRVLGEIK